MLESLRFLDHALSLLLIAPFDLSSPLRLYFRNRMLPRDHQPPQHLSVAGHYRCGNVAHQPGEDNPKAWGKHLPTRLGSYNLPRTYNVVLL